MHQSSLTVRKTPTAIQGILMFILLLCAYIAFAANWVAGSNLSEQIIAYYFNGKSVSPVISEIVNYTITIARIFANLLAAYILIKLNPKKASMLALIFLCFSLIAVCAANYWLYNIARMIMALGGSMIMVYMNTVIARFISHDKKIIANAFVTAAYNIGAVLVAIVFYLYKDIIFANWQITMYSISFVNVVLLILWLCLAKDFSPGDDANRSDETDKTAKTYDEYKYSDALKDKFVYCFSFGLGGFLFLYVMSLVSLPVKLTEYIAGDFNAEIMILSITLGGILGTLFSILIGRMHFRRKPFLLLHGILMISLMAVGIYVADNYPTIAYNLFAVAGFIMFSQYSVYLNFPHELPNMNPRKLTIMFGIFWAFAYTLYTLLNFIWSIILGAYGWNASVIFYIGFSCLYLIFVLTFPEPRRLRSSK